MKKYFIVVFLAFSFCGLYSQDERPKISEEPKIYGRLGEFKEKLKLSDEQVNKIKGLFDSLKSERAKIDSLSLLTPREKKRVLQRSKGKIDNELKNILSPEQYSQYLHIVMKKMIDKQLAVMEIKINLSEEQSKAIRPIIFQTMVELKDIRNTENFSKEERMKNIVGILRKADKKIETILHKDQIPAYEAYKEERRAERRRVLLGK
jgi:RNAse (barnase) inhibitor barstar